jgi:hypothetical protein
MEAKATKKAVSSKKACTGEAGHLRSLYQSGHLPLSEEHTEPRDVL